MSIINNESGFDKLNALSEKITDDNVNKRVCVFGQGYVGLPLSLSFALRGCSVTGVDVDEKLVNDLSSGITHHTEAFFEIKIQDILKRELNAKSYRATTDGEDAVKSCNNIIVTVGIPIVGGKHVIDYLTDACTLIGKNLKKGDLVVIRSTVIPGTTEDVLLPILEKESNMKAGEDFYLAYSSERIAEGKAFDEFANMPTLVSGVNQKSSDRAAKLLSVVCKADVIIASSIKTVETAKVFENVQRDVNIAMAQEFARFTEALGVDIFETIKLCNTHKRVNLLTPGPGVGGYCIPNAFYYLEPKAEDLNVGLDILKLCRMKNEGLGEFIVAKLESMLKAQGKKLENSRIAVYGAAMKDYSNDDRISPAIDIIKLLIKRGADVRAYDPVVPTKYDFKFDNQDEVLKDADALLVLTKQHGMVFDDLKHISELMADKPVYLDTKSVVDKSEAEKYGFDYWRI